VQLYSERLDVIGPVGTAGEIGQVELDLVPTLVQSHGHGTNKRFHTRRRLIIRSAESSSDILIVQNLHLEGEVFLQIFDDHHKKRKLDAQSLFRIRRASDVVSRDIGSYNLQDT